MAIDACQPGTLGIAALVVNLLLMAKRPVYSGSSTESGGNMAREDGPLPRFAKTLARKHEASAVGWWPEGIGQ
ncbi:MAG: hypothetical protein DWH79_02985 [Planctomycetota bacterium]|nr:MAG: hypothetical protein DWH79_02985 [Planctomycetota bacterium]